MKRRRLGSSRKGWSRRLDVADFLDVGDRRLVHVSLWRMQNAYDGEVEQDAEWWGVELSAHGDHVLLDTLEAALAFLDRPSLEKAVRTAPARFAEVIAVAQGFGRVNVVAPGTIIHDVLLDYGLAKKIVRPRFARGVLSCQLAQLRVLEEPALRLWSIRASLEGDLISKELVLERKKLPSRSSRR